MCNLSPKLSKAPLKLGKRMQLLSSCASQMVSRPPSSAKSRTDFSEGKQQPLPLQTAQDGKLRDSENMQSYLGARLNFNDKYTYKTVALTFQVCVLDYSLLDGVGECNLTNQQPNRICPNQQPILSSE